MHVNAECCWTEQPGAQVNHALLDFLTLQPCASVIPSVHNAAHAEDGFSVNAFSRIPDWENVHFAGHVDLPHWRSHTPYSADLTSVAVTSVNDSHLTDQQRSDLQSLLDEFLDIFSDNSANLGFISKSTGICHSIDTGLAEPITQVPYKLSKYEQDFLRGQLDSLLEQGCIRPSTSAWMSPPVLVKKKDNSLRLCIDFRALNKVTLRDPYPLPLITTCLDKMAGSQYFTSMDVVSAFWQVPVAECDVHKTGFCTPFGNFEWVRMPFGLINASSTFQRLMDRVLAGCNCCYPYIDDIFVYSSSWEGHLEHLREVFLRMRDSGLKLKLPKCVFAAPSVKCLGFVVSKHGVEPDPDKISCILELPRPTNVKEIKSIVGMAGYYSRFVDNFAAIVRPLHALTKKGVSFCWTKECQQAFEDLKQALISPAVLRLPDWSTVMDDSGSIQLRWPFHLTTDWSTHAMSAVLSQPNVDGHDRPIAYASRILTPAEAKYAPTEGECCALTWAVGKFRHYLHGYHFICLTDHQALVWLSTARFHNAKLERWALKLQEFSFTVIHKKGSENVVADCLSRLSNHASVASVWPTQVESQSELDNVPCAICGDAEGWDNIVICDGCERCMHLRCLVPPQTVAPSGSFFCPACDVHFNSSVQELVDDNTPLQYNSPLDPHLNDALLAYLYGGKEDADLPADALHRRSVLEKAVNTRLHQRFQDWLVVYKRVRHHGYRWLNCPPLQYRWDIIRLFHEVLGHAGVEQTLTVLHQHFHWNGIKHDITLYVKCCDSCQRSKLVHLDMPDLQQPAIYGPLQHVHVDLAGPFRTPSFDELGVKVKKKADLKAWVVLMIDYFTKVAEFAVVYSKEPAQIANVFYSNWVCRYGVPAHVTTDNGLEFATDFSHMLARLGVNHITTAVRHPSANGAVERLVKSFKQILTKHINNHTMSWLKSLPYVRMCYMNRMHSAIGVSPHEMLMGFRPDLPLPVGEITKVTAFEPVECDSADAADHIAKLQAHLNGLDEHALLEIEGQFRRNALDWHLRHAQKIGKHQQLRTGDLVLELDTTPGPLRAKARGPYVVKAIKSNGTVVLTSGETDFKDKVDFERHISLLSKYYDKSNVQ